MRGFILTVALCFSVALAACGGPTIQCPAKAAVNPLQSEYVLGISDQIQITVWKNNDLSVQATIRPDGTITMPLIGDLEAAGKTPSALKSEIEKRLESFINLEGTPITVAVTGANSYRFTVGGEVNSPGVLTSTYYVTVAEAIALAGGFTRFANKNKLVLLRRDRETQKVEAIPIDFTQIAAGTCPNMNMYLLAGDSLNVQ